MDCVSECRCSGTQGYGPDSMVTPINHLAGTNIGGLVSASSELEDLAVAECLPVDARELAGLKR